MAFKILELPRALIHNYFRMVGLVLLIIYSLALRLWENLRPAMTPITDVYDTIDHDSDLHIASITRQIVRAMLMMAMLYWKATVTVWDTISRPFRAQLEVINKFFEDLQTEYREKKKF